MTGVTSEVVTRAGVLTTREEEIMGLGALNALETGVSNLEQQVTISTRDSTSHQHHAQ